MGLDELTEKGYPGTPDSVMTCGTTISDFSTMLSSETSLDGEKVDLVKMASTGVVANIAPLLSQPSVVTPRVVFAPYGAYKTWALAIYVLRTR